MVIVHYSNLFVTLICVLSLKQGKLLCDTATLAMAASRSPAFSLAVTYDLSHIGEDVVLKDKQSEAIKLIYEGNDVFVWLSTGCGKSLCYQLLLRILSRDILKPLPLRGVLLL